MIIMLTKQNEADGRGMTALKAHTYWPEEKVTDDATHDDSQSSLPSVTYGPYTVSLLSTHTEPDIRVRELTLTHSSDPSTLRHIHHIQYTGWPDFGVPDQHAQQNGFLRVFTLYRAIRTHLTNQLIEQNNQSLKNTTNTSKVSSPNNDASSSSSPSSSVSSPSPSPPSLPFHLSVPPIVVHCSAGIGRSGVWLALDSIIDDLAELTRRGRLNDATIDVFQLVQSMRQHRQGAVQTKEQYQFIFRFLLLVIQKKLFGVGK